MFVYRMVASIIYLLGNVIDCEHFLHLARFHWHHHQQQQQRRHRRRQANQFSIRAHHCIECLHSNWSTLTIVVQQTTIITIVIAKRLNPQILYKTAILSTPVQIEWVELIRQLIIRRKRWRHSHLNHWIHRVHYYSVQLYGRRYNLPFPSPHQYRHRIEQ